MNQLRHYVHRFVAAAICAQFLTSPVSADQRPAFLIVVVDTLRADAVSSYGRVAGTTPNIDALAATGVRYSRAYAPAPRTIPTHVSLLSGLDVEDHQIGAGDRITAGDEIVFLAERLQAAGFATAGFAENPLTSSLFGFQQGFDHFTARTLDQLIADLTQPEGSGFDLLRSVDEWAASADSSRSFFVFANLFDAHEPYAVRDENPYLPAGETRASASEVVQSTVRICKAIPPERELAILAGLYLGDVAAADRKLGRIQKAVAKAAGARRLITIVTADHGEHLGEHRLLDHQYTVYEPALHIPLIVAGLNDIGPAVVDVPVTLADVAPSVVSWAGIAATGMDGRALPTQSGEAPSDRDLFAVFADRAPVDMPESMKMLADKAADKRAACGPADRVDGSMAALIRHPYKLVWFERYPPRLYDIAADPKEQHDLSAQKPDTLAALETELKQRIKRSGLFAERKNAEVDERAEDTLRRLGYGD